MKFKKFLAIMGPNEYGDSTWFEENYYDPDSQYIQMQQYYHGIC